MTKSLGRLLSLLVIAKRKVLARRNARRNFRQRISSLGDEPLLEPTSEMRSAYVSSITATSTITHVSSASTSPGRGRRNTTTKSTKKASPPRKSSGKNAPSS